MIWNDTKSGLLWIAVGDGDALTRRPAKQGVKNRLTDLF